MNVNVPTLMNEIIQEICNMRPALVARAFNLTRDHDLAQELTQVTLEKAWRNHHQFTGGNLGAWCFTILRNEYFAYKRNVRRKEVTFTDVRPDDTENLFELSVDDDRRMDMVLEFNDVLNNINKLKKIHRDVLISLMEHDTCYESMAQDLGTISGTIKSRVNRARAALNDLLAC